MPGKNPHLTALELHKQLLIAESELNRAQLAADIEVLKAGVHTITARAGTYSTIASSVAALMAGVAALKLGKFGGGETKQSWPSALLKGAGVVSNLWLALRSQNRRRRDGPAPYTADPPRP